MITPILERPNVTNLLDVDKLIDAIPDEIYHKDKIIKNIDDFCDKYGYSEIVIQADGHEKPLGLIVDAYEGEDNIDGMTIWFDDYYLPF